MKTLEQVKASFVSRAIDGRDRHRLMVFLPKEEDAHTAIEFTRENVLSELKRDVAFGFEKALNMRGISSGLMVDVVQMWNWILEDGLEHLGDDDYPQYGLPIFKATALRYGFDNPIGDDRGDEDKYSSEAEYD